jgi:hypothetical protein
MPSPLANMVIAEVVSSPEFQQLANKVFPIFGTITEYSESDGKVDLEFRDPISSLTIKKVGIPVGKMGNVHSTIERGDGAVLIFPNGNFELPVVTAILPSEEYRAMITGSYTLKASGGI